MSSGECQKVSAFGHIASVVVLFSFFFLGVLSFFFNDIKWRLQRLKANNRVPVDQQEHFGWISKEYTFVPVQNYKEHYIDLPDITATS